MVISSVPDWFVRDILPLTPSNITLLSASPASEAPPRRNEQDRLQYLSHLVMSSYFFSNDTYENARHHVNDALCHSARIWIVAATSLIPIFLLCCDILTNGCTILFIWRIASCTRGRDVAGPPHFVAPPLPPLSQRCRGPPSYVVTGSSSMWMSFHI